MLLRRESQASKHFPFSAIIFFLEIYSEKKNLCKSPLSGCHPFILSPPTNFWILKLQKYAKNSSEYWRRRKKRKAKDFNWSLIRNLSFFCCIYTSPCGPRCLLRRLCEMNFHSDLKLFICFSLLSMWLFMSCFFFIYFGRVIIGNWKGKWSGKELRKTCGRGCEKLYRVLFDRWEAWIRVKVRKAKVERYKNRLKICYCWDLLLKKSFGEF